MHLIVDGMNVIGTRPDGWWRDRGAARRRLVEELARLVDDETDVDVVFDGRPSIGEVERAADAGLHIAFAPGGPNAADDVIVTMIANESDPSGTVVVTSDRALVDRVRKLGARIESAKSFRARLDDPRGRDQGGNPSGPPG